MATRGIPTHNGPPKSTEAPNQTLYCTNLPEKIQKIDLRTSLYTLFCSYGPVLDVIVMKTKKMRGQAHVVFRDVQASTQAMRALQGFELFGKEMKIQYARGKSDTIAKLDGTYRMPLPAGTEGISTSLQQSIFNAPPSGQETSPPSTAPPFGKTLVGSPSGPVADGGPQGVKRPRDEESDDEEAPMEEDDSDAPMEASSDED